MSDNLITMIHAHIGDCIDCHSETKFQPELRMSFTENFALQFSEA